MRTIIINIDDEAYSEMIKHLDKFILDYPNSSYQVISPIPNDETLEAMQDVEKSENYEEVTLDTLKSIEEVKSGNTVQYNSVEDMMKDLKS